MRNQTISALLCLTAALTAYAAPSPQAAQPAPSKPSVVFLGKTPTTVPKSPAKPQTVSAVPANAPLIPTNFAGWETPTPKSITDPALADPANASALKEYGFSDAALATYTREGQTIQLKALRFGDASGAYGAYTFYRQSGWPKENIGAGAASDHNRILFWLGNVFVDAQVSHLSAMTASEFRELAASIPQPSGNKLLPPPILDTLPQADLDGQTTHYALGPAAYAANGGVLPPDLIGFDRGAETVTASYTLSSGPATLTIVNYPTPQMAKAAEQSNAAYLKAGNTPQRPFTKPLLDSNPKAIEVRRTGPLLAVVSGDPIQDDAHRLLSSVHYEAEMSAEAAHSQQPMQASVQKTAQLILGILTLVAVMFSASVLLALFLGGGRALYRIARGKPASSVYDLEFIKLNLS